MDQGTLMLQRQLLGMILFFQNLISELSKNPVEGFSAGLVDESNIYEWEVMILGPPDTE
jgi:ubiquitin-conjugating enzyme E2 G1